MCLVIDSKRAGPGPNPRRALVQAFRSQAVKRTTTREVTATVASKVS